MARILLLTLFVLHATCAWAADSALPPYTPEHAIADPLSSVGDGEMAPLMNAWRNAYRAWQPRASFGRWQHDSDARVFGALMFETTDMAPLAREPLPEELAPYGHQFVGDMMKSPLLVQVAIREGRPAYLAINKRAGAPLPSRITEFVTFALSAQGQAIVARTPPFQAIDAASAARERRKIDGYLVPLDTGIAPYHPRANVSGEIASVGSDGMKTLMDRWMREFRVLQPSVRQGPRWEHLGTLNGFHALLANETVLAPMGRELWASELAMYRAARHQAAPVEIRVARGGFNTPQRTTAQAIFVHADNPLSRITMAQLAAIFGEKHTITRWGQVGLTGEWADRPITIYMPPHVAPNATSMKLMVLQGGAWNPTAREGSIAQTAAAIAGDASAIGFGGFEEGGHGLKTLAVARDEQGPYYAGNAQNAASGRYPLTRYMYIRMNRKAGEKLAPPVKEFLRYVLSREGQEPIRYSGYFPLSAAEIKEELAKLE